MSLKNIILVLGIGMVCLGNSLLFVNGQKRSELSDAEIKKRAEMLGMVEPNKDAILTSELENLKNNTNTEDIENIDKQEDGEQQKQENDLQDDSEKEVEKNSDKNTSKKEKKNTKNTDKETSVKKDAESEKTSNKKISNKKKTKKSKKNKKNTNTTTVKINSGMTAGEICRKLQEEGLIEDAEDFRQYLINKNVQRKLQAGTFEIIKGADYDEILMSIYRG